MLKIIIIIYVIYVRITHIANVQQICSGVNSYVKKNVLIYIFLFKITKTISDIRV